MDSGVIIWALNQTAAEASLIPGCALPIILLLHKPVLVGLSFVAGT